MLANVCQVKTVNGNDFKIADQATSIKTTEFSVKQPNLSQFK